MKKKTSTKKSKKPTMDRKQPRRSQGKARVSKPRASTAASGQDKPNVARLIITMTSVEGSGAERMSFTASAGLGRSAHFGEDSPGRVLYDGPYIRGPYELVVHGRELDPTSDDTFESQPGTLDIDMNSLQGQGQVQVTMTPEKNEQRARRPAVRKGAKAAAGEQEDESASYTVFFTGRIEPAVEITNVDVINRAITFDLTPESVGEGNFQAIVSSKNVDADPKLDDVTIISQQVSGGRGQTLQFNWSAFSGKNFRTPFHAQSLNVFWNNLSSSAEDTWRNLTFTGYGVFRITSFITPDDGQFGGATEQAAFGGGQRLIHSRWISRVRCEEGKGVTQGSIVQIRGPGHSNADRTEWVHRPGTQRLVNGNEGSYGIARLTINRSLAKHKSDRRFRAHDTILLSTDPATLFAIEDEGNWTDDPPGPHNHLDRYRGFGGPARPPDFAPAYVVKV
jgi:hypothetical protein